MSDARDLGAHFGEFFGAIKYLSGSTDKDLAKMIDVSPVTIRNWRMLHSLPYPTMQPQIARAFGLGDDELHTLVNRTASAIHDRRLEAAGTSIVQQLGQAVLERVVTGQTLADTDLQTISDLYNLTHAEE